MNMHQIQGNLDILSLSSLLFPAVFIQSHGILTGALQLVCPQ